MAENKKNKRKVIKKVAMPKPTDKEKRYKKAVAEARIKQAKKKREALNRVSPEKKKQIQRAKARQNQSRNYPN